MSIDEKIRAYEEAITAGIIKADPADPETSYIKQALDKASARVESEKDKRIRELEAALAEARREWCCVKGCENRRPKPQKLDMNHVRKMWESGEAVMRDQKKRGEGR